MKEYEIDRMWEIDNKAQLGDKLTESEIEFFNNNYERMIDEMESNYNHWLHHTKKL